MAQIIIQVDAFTDRPFAGNPRRCVLCRAGQRAVDAAGGA